MLTTSLRHTVFLSCFPACSACSACFLTPSCLLSCFWSPSFCLDTPCLPAACWPLTLTLYKQPKCFSPCWVRLKAFWFAPCLWCELLRLFVSVSSVVPVCLFPSAVLEEEAVCGSFFCSHLNSDTRFDLENSKAVAS